VDLARTLTILEVGGDQRDDRDQAGAGEQRGDMRNSAGVLGAVLVGEAEIAAEALAQHIPIENQSAPAQLGQPALDRVSHRRLAGSGEACEPQGNPGACESQRIVAHGARPYSLFQSVTSVAPFRNIPATDGRPGPLRL
jgi:hypothetical protein